MDQPKCFVDAGQENKVYKLTKFLYVFKQEPNQWHEIFVSCMIVNVFKTNECDKCIYHKFWNISNVIISVYVDDLLIIGSNINLIDDVKKIFRSNFDMKYLYE